jgi:CRISPR-associated protein (TIGR02584 family)
MRPLTEYPRRILVAVTGMSPQILTETLWSLAVHQDPAFLPTEIHLFTTTTGARQANNSLLSGDHPWFPQLLQDYDLPAIPFTRESIEVITNTAGEAMDDIRSVEDNEAAASFITERIRQLTEDPDAALHVSLAGGRKTMGYYIGYALSLYGRPQDRLSHVLVSSPFEGSWDFFYPTPYERIIKIGNGEKTLLVDCQDARIDMADIPFVRLRDELPTRFLSGKNGFSQIVEAANRALQPPLLQLNRRDFSVIADNQSIALTDMEFVILYWLAERHREALEWDWDEIGGEFIEAMKKVKSAHSELFIKTQKTVQSNVDMYKKYGDKKILRSYFSSHISDINGKFAEVLGKKAAERYRIVRAGAESPTHFVLPESLSVEVK